MVAYGLLKLQVGMPLHLARAVVPPPRLRAKWVTFSSPPARVSQQSASGLGGIAGGAGFPANPCAEAHFCGVLKGLLGGLVSAGMVRAGNLGKGSHCEVL